MDNFEFFNDTRIIFGRGAEDRIGALTARYSKSILWVYGGSSIKRTGQYDRVAASLKAAGVGYTELPGVMPNPRLSLVYEGIRLCREKDIGFVLAVGGGSAIDTAKAIAIGAVYDGDVWDFFEEKTEPVKTLPVGTILTIPAAGSESSTSSVITKEEGQIKRPINYTLLYPKFSILDPELAFTLPKYQMACGATDILSHLMERYFTNSSDVELSDRLIESTFKTVMHNLPTVLEKPDDYSAWAEIMWSGTVAHNDLFSSGRECDWGSHAIEHQLSALYDVAHGAGLAVITPAWMKYVYRHDVGRFAQFANRVWNIDVDFFHPEKTALEGIARLEHFLHSIGLTTSLRELTGDDTRLEEMADRCTDGDSSTVGKFIPLHRQDVLAVYRLAL
ncbi:MAG: iron-containing alcohol dehydrogenase [Clostridia bacterium]|nr:iron-containing alcohol dehydrogenase [Clostridia bacterium]